MEHIKTLLKALFDPDHNISRIDVILSITMLVLYALIAFALCMVVRYSLEIAWIITTDVWNTVRLLPDQLFVILKHYFPAVGADLQQLGKELSAINV